MKKHPFYSDEVLAQFCQQLHSIYHAGISLDAGFGMLSSNTSEVPWSSLQQSIKTCGHLSLALKQDGHFPSLLIETLSVAEKVGQEAKLMQHLSTYYTQQAETKRFLKDILMMPFVLLSMLILVMAVLSYAVFPVFMDVFVSFGAQSPWWIASLLSFVRIFSVLSLVLLGLGFMWLSIKTILNKMNPQKYSPLLDSILKLLPHHQYQHDLAHFSFIAQVLLASGLDQVEALTFLLSQCHDGKLLSQIKEIQLNLDPQAGLYELLLQAKLYPPLTQNSLELAAKTGQLEEAMAQIATQTQDEAQRYLSTQLNRIEPSLVLLLTLFVSIVLFSLVLPLLGILQGLGQ